MNSAKQNQDKEYYSGRLYDDHNFLQLRLLKHSFQVFLLPMNMLTPLKKYRRKALWFML